ncbi:PREDICTED: electrogenic sodium bicarbonate cotransporter 1-like isoform X2 [Priapulus caudatus]|uniref:Anion exchange protein n=1 Tax=Priapulus caudatus TaxID=37621 RepID=A0ABM1FBK2_PRICU|nr:PREDICTED: electrogenic sodium bicarbonate cotransporter 1-like isoform X2 [Priapulus caudatus]
MAYYEMITPHAEDFDNEDDVEEPKPSLTRAGTSFTDELRNVFTDVTRGDDNPLFIQLSELRDDKHGELHWREMTRWIKFEENVEIDASRWSKPHVSTISLHALFELRYVLLNGPVVLDADVNSYSDVIDTIMNALREDGKLTSDKMESALNEALTRKFTHQIHKRPAMNKLTKGDPSTRRRKESDTTKVDEDQLDIPIHFKTGRPDHTSTTTSPQRVYSDHDLPLYGNGETDPAELSEARDNVGPLPSKSTKAHNAYMMKKIPIGSQAASILLGEVDFVEHMLSVFIRLSPAVVIPQMVEVTIPTRFVFLLLGPKGMLTKYEQTGRALGTLLTDEVFHAVAYKAGKREELLAGIDEFLSMATVLPPSIWDPTTRIEPPEHLPELKRKQQLQEDVNDYERIVGGGNMHEDTGLERTGRFCGGLIKDIKRKAKWYLSDYKDALALQVIPACVFMYVASLAPLITFGGLLEAETNQQQATMECIMAGAIVGLIFAIFAGQPLIIMSATGPMLVVESIVYQFSKSNGLDYMPFRLWIGMWAAVILVILVVVDASALVHHITRFTEECFAVLISLIFIYEAFVKLIDSYEKVPINLNPEHELTANETYCGCQLVNDDNITFELSNLNDTEEECGVMNGTLVGPGCGRHPYVGDVFLLSVILFLGTFILALVFKHIRNTNFFPTMVRNLIYDFALPMAILVMCGLDALLGLKTPKLTVPEKFAPTSPDRGWIIPLMANNPWWAPLAAILPAMLCCILIVMDQQITAVIINRKENLLKKGFGYHLDLLVTAAGILISSILGLPWFVAMTVLSINHLQALRFSSDVAAPGEKPKFLGIRENRVTAIFVAVMIGASVFLTKLLAYIPMSVLFGVFLYMGVASLDAVQFVDRLLILFIPTKYQPDYIYLRHLKLRRVHIYTFIQVLCMIVMWILKSNRSASIGFPVMILALVIVRKLLKYLFTDFELVYLDGDTPEEIVKAREDLEHKHKEAHEGHNLIKVNGQTIHARPRRGTFAEVAFVDQLHKSGTWLSINDQHNGHHQNGDPSANSSDIPQDSAPMKRQEGDITETNHLL